MNRGDIYLVQLDPALETEANKRRPAVVVSNNAANDSAERRGRGVITVVPLSTNVASIYPFQILLRSSETGLPLDSKAQAEQVRSLSTERFHRLLGTVPQGRMSELDDALRLHLSL
jgi:mRNA interferase MazF